MPSVDPFATDPYDRLGVLRTESLSDIKQKSQKLSSEYQKKYKNAVDGSQEETEHKQALNKIKEAYSEIREKKQSIHPDQIVLDAIPTKSTVQFKQDLIIEVVDTQNGNPVSDVSLRIDGRRLARTNNKGKGILKPGSTGTVAIVATRRDSGGKSYRDDAIEVEVEPKQETLEFANIPSSTTVGEPTTFIVTNEKGQPKSNVTVEAGEIRERTGSNGEATLTIGSTGKVTVTASQADTSTIEFNNARSTINVNPRSIPLHFAKYPNSIAIGSNAEFKIVTEDNDSAVGAELEFQGETKSVGKEGIAIMPVEAKSIGMKSATASKQGSDEIQYQNATVQVQVTRKSETLNIDVVSGPVVVDQLVKLRISDGSGNPICGATVAIDGQKVGKTDENGAISATFPYAGKTDIKAIKNDDQTTTYKDASTTVDVDRTQKHLRLVNFDSEVTTDTPVFIQVIDMNGQPVEGATVATDSRASDMTDQDGQAVITFSRTGRINIEATKSPDLKAKYESTTEQITTKKPKRYLQITSIPEKASVGSTITTCVVDQRGKPVHDAKLRTSTGDRASTDVNGETAISLSGIGLVKMTATKEGNEFEGYAEEHIWVEE
jgi:protocatechuate 3,4-dioxygenase beta subunit